MYDTSDIPSRWNCQAGSGIGHAMITISQLRAARGLLGWTQERLGKAAGLSADGVSAIETERVIPRPETMARLVAALESAGVEFSNGDAPGVRLRRRPPA
jgi:transcriptional regulator with XRE-family HTH domain